MNSKSIRKVLSMLLAITLMISVMGVGSLGALSAYALGDSGDSGTGIQFTSDASFSCVEGAGGTFTVTTTATSAVTYALTGEPEGVSIGADIGELVVDNTILAGDYNFTITASDSTGILQDATQAFALTVTAAAPATQGITITSDVGHFCFFGTASEFQVTATGAANIAYALDGNEPEGVAIDAAGLLTIADTVPIGEYQFTITASDADAAVTAGTQDFTLWVEEDTIITPMAVREIYTPQDWIDMSVENGAERMITLRNGDNFKIFGTAGSPATPTQIYIPAGVTATIYGDNITFTDVYIVEEDAEDQVVTLNNLKITAPDGKSAYNANSVGYINYVGANELLGRNGIYAETELTLIGENPSSITATSNGIASTEIDPLDDGYEGIAAINDLNISGTGLVTAKASTRTGFPACRVGNLTVANGAKLTANGTDTNYGMLCVGRIINNGTISVYGDDVPGSVALRGMPNDPLHIRGTGTLTTGRADVGILCKELELDGGTLNAEGAVDGVRAMTDINNSNTENLRVSVFSGTAHFKGVEAGAEGMSAGDNITIINNGTLLVSGYGSANAIHLGKDLVVTNNGTITATSGTTGGNGVFCEGTGVMTYNGAGAMTATGFARGIWCAGLTQNGGTLEVTQSNSIGFAALSCNNGNITLNSGDLGCFAPNEPIICNSVIVASGEVTMKSTNGYDFAPDLSFTKNVPNAAPDWVITGNTYSTNNSAENTYKVNKLDADDTVTISRAAGAGDVTPPTATLSPADNATGVALTSNLVLTFDETVFAYDGASGDWNFITIHNDTTGRYEDMVPTNSKVTGSGTATITINPASDFILGNQYHVTIDTGAFRDADLNEFAGILSATEWNFTAQAPAADTTPPTITGSNPANGAAVPVTTDQYQITFSEPMNTSLTIPAITGGATLAAPTWSFDKKTVTFDLAGLAASTTYTITVAANSYQDVAGNNIAAATRTFTTTAAPTYSYTVTPTGNHTFTGATVGYGAQTTLTKTINNTGTGSLTGLTITKSGANAASFTVTGPASSTLASGGTMTFTVAPNTGLGSGIYTATITVNNGNGAAVQSFNVSFTVTAAPTYSYTVTPTGNHTFTGATVGYGAQTALSKTITNTGTGGLTGLTIAKSGANAASFTVTGPASSTLASGGTTTLTVAPNTGLGAGTHTATITVNNGNGAAAQSFNVSFIVTAAGMTDAQKIAADKAALTWNVIRNTNILQTDVTANLASLPTAGANGSTITWTSTNSAITNAGIVTRPANGSGNATGNLTATISCGTAFSDTVVFALTVLELPAGMTDAQKIAADKAALTWDVIKGANTAQNNITGNLATLPTAGANGSTISWTSAPAGYVSSTGAVTRPTNGSGDQVVTLTATISCGAAPSDTVAFALTVLELPAAATHTISAIAGANGTITPSGNVTVANGADQSFTIKPNGGYEINYVTVDGNNQGAVSTYTFINVTGNHTIMAYFKPISNGGNTSNDNDDNGSGSGGGSYGSGSAIVAQTETIWMEAPEAKELADAAKNNQHNYVRTKDSRFFGIRKNALLAFAGLRYYHDTITDGAVQVRISIPQPGIIQNDLMMTGYVKGDAVNRIKTFFEKWFSSKIRVIHLEQEGDFGQMVEIAAKVDFTGMNTTNLHFYSYDKSANTYRRIEKPAYWIDTNGYLHFTTAVGGEIIISDGPLVKK